MKTTNAALSKQQKMEVFVGVKNSVYILGICILFLNRRDPDAARLMVMPLAICQIPSKEKGVCRFRNWRSSRDLHELEAPSSAPWTSIRPVLGSLCSFSGATCTCLRRSLTLSNDRLASRRNKMLPISKNAPD
jgi:hypothetical protein